MNGAWRMGLLAAGSVLLVAPAVLAQSGGGYDLTWNTVYGGGTTSSGGGYALVGTAGQPEAGSLSGGSYVLGGGFRPGAPTSGNAVYLPLVMRNP